MFPSNLHKNIVKLDKQISLLENECKSMEADKRKKNVPDKLRKCSKLQNSLKSPPVKGTQSKTGYENIRTKKLSPPFSARVQSASSLQSTCSKPWSEICNPSRAEKAKRKVNDFHPCQRHESTNNNNNKQWLKEAHKKSGEFPVHNSKGNLFQPNNSGGTDQVLHKEVLFSNPGGTIEVTVTQKANTDEGKENIVVNKKSSTLSIPEKDLGNCHCQLKGRKWSEILCMDSVKSKKSSCRNSVPNISDDNCATESNADEDSTGYFMSILNQTPKKENHITPIRLPSNTNKTPKMTPSRSEKEIQCHLESKKDLESPRQTANLDPVQVFKFLINEMKQKPNDDKKKLTKEMEMFVSKLSDNPGFYKKLFEDNQNDYLFETISWKNDFLKVVKQHCDNLMKEKELLSKEVAAKESIITTMQKREEEYLSLISSLKMNLEKTKESAQDNLNAIKECNVIKKKFSEQTKVCDALKKSHSKMQEVMERLALENDKLKTQVQIYKLESQKNVVLMAGKEAEIARYKQEIRNFHCQISEHLASLKSSAQLIDVEKMMEAIIQQSQIFATQDLDSVVPEKEEKESSSSSRQNNGLMHSSPTSSKTSLVNSSWKQISSIHENDQTIDNSEILIDTHDSGEKEFFHVFGGDSGSENKSKETLIEKFSDDQVKKKSSSFTSCLSVRNEEDDCGSTSGSKNEPEADAEKPKTEPIKLSSKEVQSNIQELLKNMKLKLSKEIRHISSDNFTVDEFLNSSQISSFSVRSGHENLVKTPKKT